MSGEEFYCNNSDRNTFEFKCGYRVIHMFGNEIMGTTAKIFISLKEAHDWASECQRNNHDEGFYTYIEEISIAECRCI